MSKKWKGLIKAIEECNELGVELAKLSTFPDGKHPGRKKSLIPTVEDECADVLNAVLFFIDRNGLDAERIEKRIAMKRKRFEKWWGVSKKASKFILMRRDV